MSSDKPNTRDLMNRGGRVIAKRGIDRDADRAARAQAGNTDTVIWVPRDNITIDEAIQVRVGGVDPATVEQYAVIMYEAGGWGPFPPVDLHRDGDMLYLSAGFQRSAAAEVASGMLEAEGLPGIDEYPSQVRPGGYEAALEYAEDDNLSHGKPLSNADKRYMFERRLERGHAWVKTSDRVIARELGVSHPTIAKWRRDAVESSTGKNLPVDTTTRIGADGREYNVSGIQDANRERAAQPQEPPESRETAPRGATGQGRPQRPPEPGGRFEDEPDNSGAGSKRTPQTPAPSGVPNGTPDEPSGRFENASAPAEDALAVAVNALTAFADALPELARQLITVRNAVCYENEPGTEALYGAVVDAFDFLSGYEGAHGKWVDGIIELLEQLRAKLGG